MRVIAADVGGTKTIVALADVAPPNSVRLLEETQVVSQDWPSLLAIVEHCIKKWGGVRPQAASFGVAGTVHPDQTCFLNRLGWHLSAEELSTKLKMPVRLTFDAAAAARGIDLCQPDELVTLRHGSPMSRGVQSVLSVGTGCGVAMRIPFGDRVHVHPTRMGLMDVGPAGLTSALVSHLQQDHDEQLDVDKLLAGATLPNVVRFLGHPHTTDAKTILEGVPTNQTFQEAVRLFARLIGRVAGNLALAHGATGGVYLAGGMCARIIWALKEENFFSEFDAHGRARAWLERIPVKVVLNHKTPLLGAAALAED